MGSSRERSSVGALAACALVLAACNPGAGNGAASGTILAAPCRDTETPYSLDPSFFSAEGSLSSLHIRIQRGSDVIGDSDGVFIDVADASAVYAMLHPSTGAAPTEVTFPLTAPATSGAVSMTVYLGQTCNTSFRDVAYVFPSVSGTVTFSAIYDPTNSGSETKITGHFDDVVFADPTTPDTRNATLSGTFDFIYNRGQPAQRFP